MSNNDYQVFLTDVKERIKQAQYKALKAVNHELVNLYWDLGQLIVTKQETLGWGKSVVEQLSKDLQMAFPSNTGFSAANLWRCRNFYLAYYENPNLAAMLREIGWTHNIMIFEKCKDDLEREFYLLHVRKFGWTYRVLTHQIENKTYEKYLLNQTNFDQVLPDDYKHQALLAIKDHYMFDFLALSGEHSEFELEQALVRNIRAFLMEMGDEFTFVGNQHRLIIEEDEFFIDLLLFHRRLQCLVAIDLKIGAFKAEYKGKMELYLTGLNRQVKMPHEQDAIGIIICKSKNKTVVEYSLSNATQPIGVATYSLSDTLPEKYKNLLPSPELIAEKLSHIKGLFKEE
jgi:predicted nuclease of restriction endonuclease-like (RecB) superfamily